MSICKFCKTAVADKTGSHIFTSSLISNCINQPGKKGRDKELMFGFGQDGSVDNYIGSQILPEKIEEIKGSSMSDEEIESNSNDLVYDYAFCTSCEKLFGVIESKFSPEIVNIRAGAAKSFKDSELARVYFLIQVLRASVVKYNDWTLTLEFEEKLRFVLFECCKKIEDKVPIAPNNMIFNIPLLISCLQTTTDASSNLIVIPNFKNPTVLFLCDFVVQIFENTENLIAHNIEVYNLNDKRKPEDFIQKTELELFILSNGDRECLIDNMVRLDLAPQFVKSYQQKFIILCAQVAYVPTIKRINYFTNLLFAEGPVILKITDENFIDCFKRTLKEIF